MCYCWIFGNECHSSQQLFIVLVGGISSIVIIVEILVFAALHLQNDLPSFKWTPTLTGLLKTLVRPETFDPKKDWKGYWQRCAVPHSLVIERKYVIRSFLTDCCSAPQQSVSILPLFLNKILLRFFPKLIGVRRMLRRSAKLSGRWQQQKGFQKISACLTTLWNSYLITIWEGLVLVFSLLRFKCRKTSRYLVKFFLK